ncbi:hypothetical protein KX729_00870 [Rhizobium sp. XQZ8]|uniref:hypothetical protein n=1 Tax=Rhizobium populisoli TaxID=2859785 RepID=UPI001CA58092|nr:hypothetical protein [Rhizobium populisoli]MBW6419989.1 hypothetical protein [Rhizobium populisoli]
MTALLDYAIKMASALPESRQDEIADAIELYIREKLGRPFNSDTAEVTGANEDRKKKARAALVEPGYLDAPKT